MIEEAITKSEDKSAQMYVYTRAANWLSENLSGNEKAMLSFAAVYWSVNPSLESKSVEFNSLWENANLFPNKATDEEVKQIRHDLKNYIKTHKEIKYLVFDWFNPTAYPLIKNLSCSKLDPSLEEIKRFSFVEPNSKHSQSLVVCKVINKK